MSSKAEVLSARRDDNAASYENAYLFHSDCHIIALLTRRRKKCNKVVMSTREALKHKAPDHLTTIRDFNDPTTY